MPDSYREIGHYSTKPRAQNRQLIRMPYSKRNIIFIGSNCEFSTDTFWLKMMFISAAYYVMNTRVNYRQSRQDVIAYVSEGYSRAELLAIENMRNTYGARLVRIRNSNDIINLMNSNDNFKLQDVLFFCHGIPGNICLNYDDFNSTRSPNIDYNNVIKNIKRDAFFNDGRIFSYACRTGLRSSSYSDNFSRHPTLSPVPYPEPSLAQRMADHFNVEVNAFFRRSNYGNIIFDKNNDHEKIRRSLILKRRELDQADKNGTQVINLTNEFEALPHLGLSVNIINGAKDFISLGPYGEKAVDYSLWRKQGGKKLPSAGATPQHLSPIMAKFNPE